MLSAKAVLNCKCLPFDSKVCLILDVRGIFDDSKLLMQASDIILLADISPDQGPTYRGLTGAIGPCQKFSVVAAVYWFFFYSFSMSEYQICMYVCMYNFAIQINKITIHDKKGKKKKKKPKEKSIYNNTKFTGRRKKAK